MSLAKFREFSAIICSNIFCLFWPISPSGSQLHLRDLCILSHAPLRFCAFLRLHEFYWPVFKYIDSFLSHLHSAPGLICLEFLLHMFLNLCLVLFTLFSFCTEFVSLGSVLTLSTVLQFVLKSLLVNHTTGAGLLLLLPWSRQHRDRSFQSCQSQIDSTSVIIRNLLNQEDVCHLFQNPAASSRNCIIIQKGCPATCLSPQVILTMSYIRSTYYRHLRYIPEPSLKESFSLFSPGNMLEEYLSGYPRLPAVDCSSNYSTFICSLFPIFKLPPNLNSNSNVLWKHNAPVFYRNKNLLSKGRIQSRSSRVI